MRILNFINNTFGKFIHWVTLPTWGDKKCIYTIKEANWWAFYASDLKKWVFKKGKFNY